jgi:hypothetical protein
MGADLGDSARFVLIRRNRPVDVGQNLQHPVDPSGRKADQAGVRRTQFEDEEDRARDGDRAGKMRKHGHGVRRGHEPVAEK